MTRRTSLGAVALVTVCSGAVPVTAQPGRSPLHGTLVPGSHGVGFTVIAMADPTRPWRPKRDASGAVDVSDRSRRLAVHVWYPAAAGAAQPAMTFGDAMRAHLDGAQPDEVARGEAGTRNFLSQFGPISDAAWQGLLGTPLIARRDAPPAAGRFPLLIGSLRPLSTTITNEYMASHGYVVAMVHGEPTPVISDPGAGLDVATRDMEFAIPELRKLPYVDRAALGALGFSGAGFSQILLAMRHPEVDAVCDLESAIFDDRMMYPLWRGWGYDVAALRVPFLHTYSVPLSKLESRIADFENMRYAPRYRYLVDAPGIHHWDFATEGMAASTVLGNRGDAGPRLRQAFETTNRYVLAFFNAHVKDDRDALAFLRRSPESNGVPAGLATIRELPAVQPAPTVEAFERIVTARGSASAMAEFEAARTRDPQAILFREDQLNRLAYRLLRGQKLTEAIAIFRRINELYPGSANTYDSLSEALEAAGERGAALDVARKGLDVLEKENQPPARKQQILDLLQARLNRLR